MDDQPEQTGTDEDIDDYPFPGISRARARNLGDIEEWQYRTEEGFFALYSSEEWWAARYQLLLSHGYRLRRRFRPGWKPSWIGTDRSPYYCDDSIEHRELYMIDAKRLNDGVNVAIKRLRIGSEESRIGLMFSTSERREDPMNHCVPILDRFVDGVEQIEYIVMPLLREFDSPPFSSVIEVLDFVRQTLQGLAYVHQQGVAHRDLASKNIMMDGNSLYPEGFHPSWQVRSPRIVRDEAPCLRRSDAAPVKYYMIDFGLSTYFEDLSAPRLVRGSIAQDQDVPELMTGLPYDPFAVDVFTLGNVYQKNLLNKFTNLPFLEPLVTAMIRHEPSNRPTADEALEQFEHIASRQSALTLHWRLHEVGETPGEAFIRNSVEYIHVVRRLPSFLFHAVSGRALTVVLLPLTVASFVLLQGPHRVLEKIREVLLAYT